MQKVVEEEEESEEEDEEEESEEDEEVRINCIYYTCLIYYVVQSI